MPDAPSFYGIKTPYLAETPLYLKWDVQSGLSYEFGMETSSKKLLLDPEPQLISVDSLVGLQRVTNTSELAQYMVRAISAGKGCITTKSAFSEPFIVGDTEVKSDNEKCPLGTFAKKFVWGQVCKPCMAGCEECTDEGSCSVCKRGFGIDEFSDGQRCQACPKDCSECDNPDTCTKCAKPTVLDSETGQCSACDQGSYFESGMNMCLKCEDMITDNVKLSNVKITNAP